MTRPRNTLWKLEAHSRGKHQILRRYIQAWLPIMSKGNRRIVIVDAFAGPGRYLGGEEGSPLILLDGSMVGFETKLGSSRYLATQRAKDAWIALVGGTLKDGSPVQFITGLIRG